MQAEESFRGLSQFYTVTGKKIKGFFFGSFQPIQHLPGFVRFQDQAGLAAI